MFDLSANTWTKLPDVPETLTHAGCATDGNTMYLAGGFLGDWKGPHTPLTNHVWKFDVVMKKWSAGPSLPSARAAGGLVRVGRLLHFFGGMNASIKDASEHWTYDLDKKDGWKSAPAMPNPRNHFGYVVLGTKIYALGGQHELQEQTGVDDAVNVYDTATKKWSTLASLPIPRSHTHNATFVRNGRIVTVGGATTGDQDMGDVLEYDHAANVWRTLAQLPAPRTAAAAQLVDGKIVVATGAIHTIEPQTTVWVEA